MIQRLNLLHYLTKDTYVKICTRLGLDKDAPRGNIAVFENEKLSKIDLYHIDYKEFGHIWFMDVEVDFPKFACDYDMFGKMLYEQYRMFFKDNIMEDFPPYDQLCCTYIEYTSMSQLNGDSAGMIDLLKEKCVPEQLDKALWDKYKKPHGTIEFCLSIEGNTVETLARCHGTALKKRVTDSSLHKTVGLIPKAAINQDTETAILNWLYKRYNMNDVLCKKE